MGILYPAAMGALTQLYAGTSPEVTMNDNGGYFIPWARRGRASGAAAYDEAAGERLWTLCDKMMADAGASVDV